MKLNLLILAFKLLTAFRREENGKLARKGVNELD